MTRVEGYRPMFGEAELREIFGGLVGQPPHVEDVAGEVAELVRGGPLTWSGSAPRPMREFWQVARRGARGGRRAGRRPV